MIRRMAVLAVITVVCGGFLEVVHADVLYTTPGYSSTSPTDGWKDGYFADPFTISTSSTLSTISFELLMRNDLGLPLPPTLDVGILSDNSNTPGSLLFSNAAASVVSSQDDGVWSAASDFDVWELTVNTSPLSLSGMTQYWLVLGLPGTGKVFWASTATTGHQTYYSGSTYSSGNVAGPYLPLDTNSQFQYELGEAASVPEPMTLVLIGTGLVGMLGRNRRNSH